MKISKKVLILPLIITSFLIQSFSVDERFISLSELRKKDQNTLSSYIKISSTSESISKLNKIGDKLINSAGMDLDVKPEFWLVKNENSPRAFNSGVVIFPNDLFEKNLDETDLLVILAHEIAHISRKHFGISNILNNATSEINSVEKYKKALLKQKVSTKFSHIEELEADITAATYLRKIGINPKVMLKTYNKLTAIYNESKVNLDKEKCSDNLGLKADHPSWQVRTCYLEKNIDQVEEESKKFYQGLLYTETDETEKAIDIFEKMEKSYFKNSIEVTNNLGLLYYKKYMSSINNLEMLPSLSMIRSLFSKKGGEKNKNDLNKSIRQYQKILDFYPIEEISKKDKDKLVNYEDLKKYLNIVYNNYAVALVQTDIVSNKIKAVELLNIALKLDPESPITNNNLGFVIFNNYNIKKIPYLTWLFQEKDIEIRQKEAAKEAISYFTMASKNAKFSKPKFNLAMCYVKLGEKEEAKKIFQDLSTYPSISKMVLTRASRDSININKVNFNSQLSFTESIGSHKLGNIIDSNQVSQDNIGILETAKDNKINKIVVSSPFLETTSKGIKIGDDFSKVKDKYGEPVEIDLLYKDCFSYTYLIDNQLLNFIVLDNKVQVISLQYSDI